MKQEIDIQQADLSTAAVQIQTVEVKGRQLTLRTFRQIKEECILKKKDTELQAQKNVWHLRGVPWGTVNYFWGENKKQSDGLLHLLWQSENELRRCLLPVSFSAAIKRYDLAPYIDENKLHLLWQLEKCLAGEHGYFRFRDIRQGKVKQKTSNHRFGSSTKEWVFYVSRFDRTYKIERGERLGVREIKKDAALIDEKSNELAATYRSIREDLSETQQIFIAT